MLGQRFILLRASLLTLAGLLLASGAAWAHGGGGGHGGGHGGGGHGGHVGGVGHGGGFSHGLGYAGHHNFGVGFGGTFHSGGIYGNGFRYGLGYSPFFGRGYQSGYNFGLGRGYNFGLGSGFGLGYGLGYGLNNFGFGLGYGGFGVPYGLGVSRFGLNFPYYGNYGNARSGSLWPYLGYNSGWAGAYPYSYYGYYGPNSTTPYNAYTSSYGRYPADAAIASSTSRVPPPPKDNLAHLLVIVPDKADLWFNGTKTKKTGPEREFVSPELQPDKHYSYEVKASWQENGKTLEQVRKVRVQANDWRTVDFTKPEPDANAKK